MSYLESQIVFILEKHNPAEATYDLNRQAETAKEIADWILERDKADSQERVDSFAAMALAGLAANRDWSERLEPTIAHHAYRLAHAMETERAKLKRTS